MERISKTGKNFEDTLACILEENNLTQEEVIYKTGTTKKGLFKTGTVEVIVYKKNDIYEFAKNFLKEVINNLGLEVTFETKKVEDRTVIKMYSNNNPILIGKNGQTLTALTAVCKAAVFARIGVYPYLNLDASDYKDKQVSHLERLAKNIAREVRNTGREVVMDNMNSYERRIVHNVLTDFKGVTTISEGEEPNRHIIVKPKKD